MALFKVFRGTSENLPSTIHDGYAYLTTDDGKFYIDTSTRRILINPNISSAYDISYMRDGVLTNVGAVLDDLLAQQAVSIEVNTSQYWSGQAGRQISKQGTFYVYSDGYLAEDGVTYIPRIKLGDGSSYIMDLPFLDQGLLNMIVNHINDGEVHITQTERLFWNNKLNVDDNQQIVNNSLIFNRN